jgi:hypothetical protein
MYEHRSEKLLTPAAFRIRIAKHVLSACGAIAAALGIGVLGYHVLNHLPWDDALVDASMILGGMGPVNPLQGTAAKLFASAYALFSGLFFIGLMGFLLAPFAHRLMHHFHVDEADGKTSKNKDAS